MLRAGADVKEKDTAIDINKLKKTEHQSPPQAAHSHDIRPVNSQTKHAILRYANTTPFEKRFVFHVHGVGTCRAARGRVVFCICLNPSV